MLEDSFHDRRNKRAKKNKNKERLKEDTAKKIVSKDEKLGKEKRKRGDDKNKVLSKYFEILSRKVLFQSHLYFGDDIS